MDNVTRTPLCWPSWCGRTKATDRKFAAFGKKNDRGWGKEKLTLAQARNRVLNALEGFNRVGKPYRCHPDSVIISSDLKCGRDGYPLGSQKKPDDPGVAVYFTLDGKSRCIPCDYYTRIEDNLAAAAATVEALRAIERHGSGMFEAAFRGFDALPSPDHIVSRNWRDVLDYYGEDLAGAKLQYQRLRKIHHPDSGGNAEAFDEVQKAWGQAQEALV